MIEFANRLRKNHTHLAKWARRKGIHAYRVYDADLPHYALAVDLYPTIEDGLHLHVQEYAPPKSIDPEKAATRLAEALAALQIHFDVPDENIHLKRRRIQKGDAQYQKLNDEQRMFAVEEHGCALWINFDDYLDTGLFLDHRPLRQRIGQEAAGKRVLNLFCYTGAGTIHAACGGAVQTMSVDLSTTYLNWAGENLRLNHFESDSDTHRLIRADCLEWLAQQVRSSHPPEFDLIFCDPPSFSNSKKMDGVLDVQRDHVGMIEHCVRLLAPDGVLYFSNNYQRFKLDSEALQHLKVQDITTQTLDEDFKRPPPAHRAWRIQRA